MESKKNEARQILFFDGVCHLCNGFVDFLIQNEKQKASLIYAPLQGETAKLYLSKDDQESLQSVVFYDQGKLYREADAILRVSAFLSTPWRYLASFGWLVPNRLRQKTYQFVARNRYKWFGQREFCRLPKPEEKDQLWP